MTIAQKIRALVEMGVPRETIRVVAGQVGLTLLGACALQRVASIAGDVKTAETLMQWCWDTSRMPEETGNQHIFIP